MFEKFSRDRFALFGFVFLSVIEAVELLFRIMVLLFSSHGKTEYLCLLPL
jgi:hypothetical protein